MAVALTHIMDVAAIKSSARLQSARGVFDISELLFNIQCGRLNEA